MHGFDKMLLGVDVCSHSYKVSLVFCSLPLYDSSFLWLNINSLSVLIYVTVCVSQPYIRTCVMVACTP